MTLSTDDKIDFLEERLKKNGAPPIAIRKACKIAKEEMESGFKIVPPWNEHVMSNIITFGLIGLLGGLVYHYFARNKVDVTWQEAMKKPTPVVAAEKHEQDRLSRRQIAMLYALETDEWADFKKIAKDDQVVTFDHVYEVGKMFAQEKISKDTASFYINYMFENNAQRFTPKEAVLAKKILKKQEEANKITRNEFFSHTLYGTGICGAVAMVITMIGLTVADESLRRRRFKETWEALIVSADQDTREEIYKVMNECRIPSTGKEIYDEERNNNLIRKRLRESLDKEGI